ncbi:MAG TPA: phosphatidylglycerophosphatase A [Candidatus Acidoferrales bacterium]|nr:phosphatidylglycerophosphatase A [Candidatus Acidoferrales bacterium]
MNTKSEATPAAGARKPWFSLFVATAGGAGYLPAVPGTWGSLVGVVLYGVVGSAFSRRFVSSHVPAVGFQIDRSLAIVFCCVALGICFAVALLGVASASRVALFTGKKDPQIVVIDEVSGQFITYLLALAPLNWKYLLLGFILFRGFDVWKPFPARQAEALPGGWGIMADDWIAGIYAAIGLWIARGFGL